LIIDNSHLRVTGMQTYLIIDLAMPNVRKSLTSLSYLKNAILGDERYDGATNGRNHRARVTKS
jgi:hypothetical protein